MGSAPGAFIMPTWNAPGLFLRTSPSTGSLEHKIHMMVAMEVAVTSGGSRTDARDAGDAAKGFRSLRCVLNNDEESAAVALVEAAYDW